MSFLVSLLNPDILGKTVSWPANYPSRTTDSVEVTGPIPSAIIRTRLYHNLSGYSALETEGIDRVRSLVESSFGRRSGESVRVHLLASNASKGLLLQTISVAIPKAPDERVRFLSRLLRLSGEMGHPESPLAILGFRIRGLIESHQLLQNEADRLIEAASHYEMAMQSVLRYGLEVDTVLFGVARSDLPRAAQGWRTAQRALDCSQGEWRAARAAWGQYLKESFGEAGALSSVGRKLDQACRSFASAVNAVRFTPLGLGATIAAGLCLYIYGPSVMKFFPPQENSSSFG